MNKVHLTDCMEFMKGVPDKYYELSICDPPYGIGASSSIFTREGKQTGKSLCVSGIGYKKSDWDNYKPDKKYFNELIRISKNQIIWGGNYFSEFLPSSSCWVVWDKLTGSNLYADCELAYTSFDLAVRKITFQWMGMLQGDMKNKESRIHPTQKPVALYKWLLKNYAKPNDKIFDSHVGSGSIRIACHDMGFDFEGCEIDKDYWEAQEARYNTHISQFDLFTGSDLQAQMVQRDLI